LTPSPRDPEMSLRPSRSPFPELMNVMSSSHSMLIGPRPPLSFTPPTFNSDTSMNTSPRYASGKSFCLPSCPTAQDLDGGSNTFFSYVVVLLFHRNTCLGRCVWSQNHTLLISIGDVRGHLTPGGLLQVIFPPTLSAGDSKFMFSRFRAGRRPWR